MEWEALQKAIDQDYLVKQGMMIGPLGELKKDNGRTILPAGFKSAIKKLIGK